MREALEAALKPSLGAASREGRRPRNNEGHGKPGDHGRGAGHTSSAPSGAHPRPLVGDRRTGAKRMVTPRAAPLVVSRRPGTGHPAVDRDWCADPPALRLEPGQVLLVIAHDRAPLRALRQGADGLVIELKRDDVEIKVRRRLRLSANTIELAAGSGGLDVRTEGDAVTRARAIRLN
jgi:hypothetical protein